MTNETNKPVKTEKDMSPYAKMAIALSIVLSAVVYLILGFVANIWHLTWLVYFSVPLTILIVLLPRILKTKNKDAVIVSLSIAVTAITVSIIYLIIGLSAKLWHPTWIMFFIIPIAAIIAITVKDVKKKNNKSRV